MWFSGPTKEAKVATTPEAPIKVNANCPIESPSPFNTNPVLSFHTEAWFRKEKLAKEYPLKRTNALPSREEPPLDDPDHNKLFEYFSIQLAKWKTPKEEI